MQVNSLYSYPYLKKQKPSILHINIYNLSSTKLEISAEQFLLRGGVWWGERGEGGGRGKGGGGEREER
jgi:hypothetical protein